MRTSTATGSASGNMPGRVHAHARLTPPTTSNRADQSVKHRAPRRRSSVRPACGPGSLPAGIHTTGATPPTAWGGVCCTGCDTRCCPPPSPIRASGRKGGVAPVFPLSAGADRVTRSRTKNPNNDSAKWKGGMLQPPPRLCCTPPCVGATFRSCPAPCHAPCPGRDEQAGPCQVAASGLMSRVVFHVAYRSMAPRAVVLVGVPSGRARRFQ